MIGQVRMSSKRRIAAIVAAAITALSAVCVCTAVGEYSVQKTAAKTTRKLPIYSVARTDKAVAISFDCAWGVEHTDAILDALEKNEIRCTFFAVQFWVEKHPEYAKKIVEAGHELGTHSKTHPYMSKLSKEAIDEELSSSCKAIEKATGVHPTLFRPPYGDYDDLLVERASEQKLFTIQWDVDSLDWKNLSATEIALRIINGVGSGSIILCHNNGLHTAEALPMVFSTLKNRGFSFLPIGELIYQSGYEIDHTGKQHPVQ